MTSTLSITDLPINGKKVLMRVDFNVPCNEWGEITDDTRIKAALESINYVIERGGALILMSHLGRPKGVDSSLSLKRVGERLSELIGREVKFAPDCIRAAELVKNLAPGEVLLLENLRFYPAEEKPEKDPSFAEKLASYGDLYVNDAFGTAHRAHSSVTEVPKVFPQKSAAGFLMQKEIEFLGYALKDPKRPFIAVIGGAKVSTKIGVLKSLSEKVDMVLIGGAMAFTFMKARGLPIGNSLCEENLLEEAKEILQVYKSKNIPFILPIDFVAASEFRLDAPYEIVEKIPDGYQGMDIGPKTIELYKKDLEEAGTVFWNGPMGVFEFKPFSRGTFEIAKTIASLKAITIVGGGDSVAAINQCQLEDKFSHISTGGGASLEYIEFGDLPGIEALTRKS